MVVIVRIVIDDEDRRELAKDLGKSGLATREDVRGEVFAAWEGRICTMGEDDLPECL